MWLSDNRVIGIQKHWDGTACPPERPCTLIGGGGGARACTETRGAHFTVLLPGMHSFRVVGLLLLHLTTKCVNGAQVTTTVATTRVLEAEATSQSELLGLGQGGSGLPAENILHH